MVLMELIIKQIFKVIQMDTTKNKEPIIKGQVIIIHNNICNLESDLCMVDKACLIRDSTHLYRWVWLDSQLTRKWRCNKPINLRVLLLEIWLTKILSLDSLQHKGWVLWSQWVVISRCWMCNNLWLLIQVCSLCHQISRNMELLSWSKVLAKWDHLLVLEDNQCPKQILLLALRKEHPK